MQTKGEYRVGISFNPSQDDAVSRIKRAAADLIDMIEDIAVPPASGDPGAIRSADHAGAGLGSRARNRAAVPDL